ncbi:MAG: prepilin-type N-terminal cleavage/methylation domain-containing protein [bacterium]|nr:prepilin-type N-terminal cleavage/methylation domain-containing protein [bacterium]
MRHTRGFSLLEVLIVVTIVSAIATIAIPGLLNAMHRGRQGATIADMRTIATALERYAVDNQSYPAVEEVQELAGELEPEYIKELPLVDGWSHPYAYEADQRGTTYTLRSPGKDGELQNAELIPITHDFAADIVCVDGVFVQRPVGRQGEEDDDTEPSEPL